MVAATCEAKRHQSGADSIEDAAANFRAHPDEGQSKNRARKRIQLHVPLIGVVTGQQVLSSPDGPTKIGSALAKMHQEKPTVDGAGYSDGRRNYDSQSQGWFCPDQL
jgi:hypothetical protein